MEHRKTDNEIKQQILRELKWDSRIGWAQIGVEVRNGVVALTGAVSSFAKKSAAQQAAHRIKGVLDVANDIEVKPDPMIARTDAEIARGIRQVLEWDALVPDERIKSTVSDGWVTLEGDVDCWRERLDAEHAVLRLVGVIGVTNMLAIKPSSVSPEVLRDQIECALERRADREAERLRIECHDGTVDLFGRVHSWQEKRAIIGALSHASGVQRVRDHVRIDPYF